MADELKKESAHYQENLTKWRKEHLGQYVLIKGDAAIGFFNSLEAAFKEGTKQFGLDPFFVKQITPADSVRVSLLGRPFRRTA